MSGSVLLFYQDTGRHSEKKKADSKLDKVDIKTDVIEFLDSNELYETGSSALEASSSTQSTTYDINAYIVFTDFWVGLTKHDQKNLSPRPLSLHLPELLNIKCAGLVLPSVAALCSSYFFLK